MTHLALANVAIARRINYDSTICSMAAEAWSNTILHHLSLQCTSKPRAFAHPSHAEVGGAKSDDVPR